MPLTRDRAKPGVPFGGRYRIIDFVLSNFVNSGFYRIKVLTQYKSQSLSTHLSRAWRLARVLDHFVEAVPAQQRTGLDWYKGSADAVFQNLNLIDDEDPTDVAVFGGDHIYFMDVSQMLKQHRAVEAHLTIAAIPVPKEEASAFGILEVDDEGRILTFEEKPKDPKTMPGRPDWCLASMGNYFFERRALVDAVVQDATRRDSAHDFGRNIIPDMMAAGLRVFAYDFSTNHIPGQPERGRGYWRDVGTLAQYHQASLDLVGVNPLLNLYNPHWPIRSDYLPDPPAKFVHDEPDRTGIALQSLVCDGVIISGGRIHRSILGPRVRVHSFSRVESSILFDRVVVHRHVQLRRCIVDKDVVIPAGMKIGFDSELDQRRGLTVTRDGLTVIPKGMLLDPTS